MKRLARGIALEVIPNFFIGTLLYVAVFLVQRVLAQPFLSALPAASFAPWLIYQIPAFALQALDRKSTRLNSSHRNTSRMPSSA